MSQVGRPSLYTPELVDEICARLVEGQSLRTICNTEGFPDMRTVMRWLREKTEFRQQYARAKDEAADAMVEEMLHIADTPVQGVRRKVSEDGVEETYEDMISHRKLQVDTRKWIASKLKPKKYGDKLELAGDADSPLTVVVRKFGDA